MILRPLCHTAVMLVCAMWLTGCASLHEDLHVRLSYGALPSEQTPLSELKPMTIGICVEDRRDEAERDRVGNRINSFGAVLAKTVPQPQPPEAMQKALKTQFENNGLTVILPGETNAPPADAMVVVEINRYWCEAKMHFWEVEVVGTVNAEVTISISSSPTVILSKSLGGSYHKSEQVVQNLEYQNALNGALKEFIHEFSFDPAILDALRKARSE